MTEQSNGHREKIFLGYENLYDNFQMSIIKNSKKIQNFSLAIERTDAKVPKCQKNLHEKSCLYF